MKKYILLPFFIAILLASCSNPDFKQEQISLIPEPVSFTLNKSSFLFNANTPVSIQDDSQKKAANYLVNMLNRAAGFELTIVKDSGTSGLRFVNDDQLKAEAYHLEVTSDGILVKASDEAGFFNAVQTIRQLLPVQIESKKVAVADWLVPCCLVDDEPRFSWRGMHMDFSRHFFNIDEVKAFLDYMALYKLNTYHMHLTDDQGWRIEIKKYPLLTEKGAWRIENNQDTLCNERAVENELYKIDERNYQEINGQRMYGGFFTQEQIKEIIAYADERCITVVPEIDMPGHFKSAIDNYPFLSCNEESGWDTVFTYPTCLGKETTYVFMENILSEIVALFPGEYIHIGGDEVNVDSWKKCEHCQKEIKKNNLKDEHELQSHFNRRIQKFLQDKGKRFLGWDEIVRGGLTKDASIMWWRNWAPNAPKIAANNGSEIVVTTTAAYYFDYLNEGNSVQRIYEYEPVPADFTAEQEKFVLGVQANLWSERIASFKRLQYQAFPRLLALAETAWIAKEEKDLADFNQRLEKQYARMDEMGIYYYIPAVKGLDKKIVFVDSTLVTLSLAYPIDGVDIYYTLDGSIPTKNSLLYSEPFAVNKEGTIKARAYKGDVFNDLKSAELEHQEYRVASSVTPKNKGLQKWIFAKKFDRVEDIQVSDKTQSTPVESIELGDLDGKVNFAMVFQGFFLAEKDGVYEFELKSDGGSLLNFGDEMLIDKGADRSPRKKQAKIALQKGWHSFQVRYKASSRPKMITLSYAKQGEPLQELNKAVCAY